MRIPIWLSWMLAILGELLNGFVVNRGARQRPLPWQMTAPQSDYRRLLAMHPNQEQAELLVAKHAEAQFGQSDAGRELALLQEQQRMLEERTHASSETERQLRRQRDAIPARIEPERAATDRRTALQARFVLLAGLAWGSIMRMTVTCTGLLMYGQPAGAENPWLVACAVLALVPWEAVIGAVWLAKRSRNARRYALAASIDNPAYVAADACLEAQLRKHAALTEQRARVRSLITPLICRRDVYVSERLATHLAYREQLSTLRQLWSQGD